jgi:DNA-binding transcriptional MerR regulator
MTDQSTSPNQPFYRIGAVSRLTGITPFTLRVWERRYRAVQPQRSEGGDRLYTRLDITRLTLMKRLADGGDAVGAVAQLSLAQLQTRLADTNGPMASPPAGAADRPCRIVVLGDALPARIQHRQQPFARCSLVGAFTQPQDLPQQAAAPNPTVLVVERPTVSAETALEVLRLTQQTGAHYALVVYGFGARGALQQLTTSRMVPVRAPVSLEHLERECLRLAARTAPSAIAAFQDTLLNNPIPPRIFADATLGRFAEVSTSVECECPHHLAELVSNLSAFEAYSAQCESRSTSDQALHAHLYCVAAHARALLEGALKQVAQAEGLEALLENNSAPERRSRTQAGQPPSALPSQT